MAELLAEAKYYCISELAESCEQALLKRERDAEPICRVPLITSQKEEQLLISSTSKVVWILIFITSKLYLYYAQEKLCMIKSLVVCDLFHSEWNICHVLCSEASIFWFRVSGIEAYISLFRVSCADSFILKPTNFPSTQNILILGNNQIEALFHVFIYFMSLHVSSITALIIRRSNCITTSSGIISLCKWLLGMPVLTGIPSSHSHTLIIPDDVLIQFDLLKMSAVMLETCRDTK